MVGIFFQYYQLYPTVQIICSMASRLVAGVAIKTCLIFMAEVFHTPIRNTAVSIGEYIFKIKYSVVRNNHAAHFINF